MRPSPCRFCSWVLRWFAPGGGKQLHHPFPLGGGVRVRSDPRLRLRERSRRPRLTRGELLLALLLFNIGIEIGQDVFVFLVLALKRSFRQLEIQWPQWALRLPGYAVGVAGVFWTLEHTTALFQPGG